MSDEDSLLPDIAPNATPEPARPAFEVAGDEPLPPYGLLAEFEHAEELLEAIQRTRKAGYVKIDSFTPIPLHGLTEAMGHRATRLPYLTAIGGVLGGVSGYAMQYWSCVLDYPLNVGGRPLHSWPSFMPVVFELSILGASFFTVLGMLGLNGLPQPYHPVFNAPEFRMASRDRMFLLIEARDPKFDLAATREFLQSLNPMKVLEVEP